MDFKRNVNGKMLRCGYTTGSCAAAAAKAGAILLFSKAPVSSVTLNTPKGIPLTLDVFTIGVTNDQAVCAVKKDSGDDPDITNGILVCATVSRVENPSETEAGSQVKGDSKIGEKSSGPGKFLHKKGVDQKTPAIIKINSFSQNYQLPISLYGYIILPKIYIFNIYTSRTCF